MSVYINVNCVAMLLLALVLVIELSFRTNNESFTFKAEALEVWGLGFEILSLIFALELVFQNSTGYIQFCRTSLILKPHRACMSDSWLETLLGKMWWLQVWMTFVHYFLHSWILLPKSMNSQLTSHYLFSINRKITIILQHSGILSLKVSLA